MRVWVFVVLVPMIHWKILIVRVTKSDLLFRKHTLAAVQWVESGYLGDGQTQQKTMTIIQERENEDSGWRNRQIQRHFGKFAG